MNDPIYIFITTLSVIVITYLLLVVYACLIVAKQADKIIEEEFKNKNDNDTCN